MPHCIIEYAQPIESLVSPKNLMQAVHKGTANSGLFKLNDIKVRAIPYVYFLSGDDAEQNFIHVCIKMLSGRTLEQRVALSHSVLYELNQVFMSEISLTVEVVDIEKSSYAKQVK